MISRIFSDLEPFKAIEFRPGLNVLLADRHPAASDRDTRNGSGKTSLVELIHFLFGADAGRTIFSPAALQRYTFGIEFDLGKSRTIVERCGKTARDLIVQSGDTQEWPIKPEHDLFGRRTISNEDWKTVLGTLMFGLLPPQELIADTGHRPSFRQLFAYFVRRQQAKAFSDATKQNEMQAAWDQQVALSFILGLDWTIPQQWQVIRDEEKELATLRKVASGGALGQVVGGTAAELRSRLFDAEERARLLRESLNSYRLLDRYEQYEQDASRLTREINDFTNENVLDRRLVADLQYALRSETPPSYMDLDRLYREVGLVLPDTILQRFEDVKAFHESVTSNRKQYLGKEIEDALSRIAGREKEMQNLDRRRSEVFEILQTHGALDHYSQMQAELTRAETEVELLQRQYDAAERLAGGKTEIEIRKRQLQQRLSQELHDQTDTIRLATLTFKDISGQLYEHPGDLQVDSTPAGLSIKPTISGERSLGINNMQIFCFDMMLMRASITRGYSPGFLVHDSHLFDGVDERQTARALRVGADLAQMLGFQYIVTMNSDVYQTLDVDAAFSERHVLPVRFTDATDDGGLFGFRF